MPALCWALLAVPILASPTQMTRRELSANGQQCSKSSDCTSQYCGHGHCKDKKANGHACYKDNGCVSGHCFDKTTCADAGQTALANGYHCSKSTMCSSGYCGHAKCDDKKANGSRCYKHQGCLSDQCVDKRCIASLVASSSTRLLPSMVSARPSSTLKSTTTSSPKVSTSTRHSSSSSLSSTRHSSSSSSSTRHSSSSSSTSTSSSSSSSPPSSSATQIILSPADKQSFYDIGFTPESLDEISSRGLPLSTQEANDAALAKLLGVDVNSQTKKRSPSLIYDNSTIGYSGPLLKGRDVLPFCDIDNPPTCSNPTQTTVPIETNGCGDVSSPNFAFFLNFMAPQLLDACNHHDVCFGESDYSAD